ncbi:GntR family transcriptional regulator [Psychrosphaera saromensis]|uniref:GntR family transcriptional regulator n=1 Tax=Psychrosphaera saromensis TaxID=716813 RepID=A0A2S7UTD6_9GAMM|nr:S1-like domain-containing RNA-binding protein [Psychrosphaera saromensis]PQJ53207.1 GntR family transcriptional regulator [Psychrosphaera saromensis]GHB67161.1 GntR family transcriptional regulator [Psychrosphaera saromensis]GLQ15030.1 GntR family transcriptional regulator [Psychrosphaera saromensis]
MSQIGQSCNLDVVKAVDFGFYLDGGELGEILLPRKHARPDLKAGDDVNVFLYLDSDDRPIATTQRPKAKVGQFAYLKVKEVGRFGAFMDWGLDKDLLVPYGEQHKPLEEGYFYLVRVYIDDIDHRITGSTKVDRFVIEDGTGQFEPNQPVELIIANTTDLGFKAIINHTHWGVLFTDEVHQRLSFGQDKKGFIKRIRHDGKIDLTLNGGQKTRDKFAKIIIEFLEKENGFAAVHDKSDPALISQLFGMSKAAFKRAIGGLYKDGTISISKSGIRLNEEKDQTEDKS